MLKNGRFHTASPTPKKAQIGTRYWFIALFPVVCYLTGGASFPYLGFIMQIHTPKKHFGAQCKGKHGELWYHFMIHYNVKHFKGSYGRPESHISLILDYQFCACVMRTSGAPQLQVIRMERLYGYK